MRVCSGGQAGGHLQSSYCTHCARPGVFAYVKLGDPLESRAIGLQLAWPFTSYVLARDDSTAGSPNLAIIYLGGWQGWLGRA